MDFTSAFKSEISYNSEKEKAVVLGKLFSLRKRILAVQCQEMGDIVQKFNEKVLEFYEYKHFVWLKLNHPIVLEDLREFYGLDEEMDEEEYRCQADAFWRQAVRHTNGDEFKLYVPV